jgi:long-chain acyl-CoA synthetase
MRRADPILTAFDAIRSADPARPLILTPTRTMSSGQLHSLAQGLVDRFRFAPGELIGLDGATSPNLLAGYLATRRQGAVPLLLDHHAPAAEKARALVELGATQQLLTDEQRVVPVPSRDDSAPLRLDPELGAVKLTSGSSGSPRGVLVTSEALAVDEAQLWNSMGLTLDDRLLTSIPLTHSYGFSSLLLPCLMRGVPLVIPDQLGPLTALHAAEICHATFFPTVPAFLAGLNKMTAPPPLAASIRLVIAAGALLTPAVAKSTHQRFGRKVHVFYGASESGGICFDRIGDAALRGSVGTPIEGVALQLSEDRQLIVRSAAVASGYHPVANPRLADGRFVTGDLARLHDTAVFLEGRADDLINVKGKKVAPREVEAVIAQLPGVEEVVVFGIVTDDGSSLVRAVIACPAGGLSYDQVVAHCRSELAEHKVPRSVAIVPELPRTERGKLDRLRLARC